MNFYDKVNNVTGNINGNQNLRDMNQKGDRNIEIEEGNYNEKIKGNYSE